MNAHVKVRFAPSPTGRLHVGNARVALINWLFARKAGGVFQLRLDDTDTERSTNEFAEAIRTDLAWLGLGHDETFRQSDRMAFYAEAVAKLKASGRLYPCYETAAELDLKRKLARASHRPPVYDRAALKLSDAERARLEAEGRRPHWRFRLDQRVTGWLDLVHGTIEIDAASLSDPVLLREDGRPLYTLSSVVDDGLSGVTHIIRGEDHITNTAAQIQIMQALDYSVPTFAHLALLVGADGQGLSKRLGALSLGQMRDDGLEAMAINSLLARLGSADPVEPRMALADLVPGFDISRFGKAPAHFDPHELELLNARVLQGLGFDAVSDRLGAGYSEALWLAVRGNLARLPEAAEWLEVVQGAIAPVLEGEEVRAAAARLLPPEPWTEATWEGLTRAITAETGAKGRALFHPLRLALTGREKGPEMKRLLPLIGAARARARLTGEKA